MAYTATDLANIQAAIVAKASGRQPTQVSSGDKMIKYAEMSLSDLRALEAEVRSSLAESSAPNFRNYAKQGGRC